MRTTPPSSTDVYATTHDNNTAIVNGDDYSQILAQGGDQYVVVPSTS